MEYFYLRCHNSFSVVVLVSLCIYRHLLVISKPDYLYVEQNKAIKLLILLYSLLLPINLKYHDEQITQHCSCPNLIDIQSSVIDDVAYRSLRYGQYCAFTFISMCNYQRRCSAVGNRPGMLLVSAIV
jgi:hypothetical protein